jgi:MFS superfamily sulfate permease-like transporter
MDYALIVAILALIVVFGVLPGTVAGFAIAVVVFVMTYSQVDVVRHMLDSITSRSRTIEILSDQQLLRSYGEQIFVLQLEGFLFFGTAHELYERLRQRTLSTDKPKLHFALLDFQLVSRLDSTAILSFTRMLQRAEASGAQLLRADGVGGRRIRCSTWCSTADHVFYRGWSGHGASGICRRAATAPGNNARWTHGRRVRVSAWP